MQSQSARTTNNNSQHEAAGGWPHESSMSRARDICILLFFSSWLGVYIHGHVTFRVHGLRSLDQWLWVHLQVVSLRIYNLSGGIFFLSVHITPQCGPALYIIKINPEFNQCGCGQKGQYPKSRTRPDDLFEHCRTTDAEDAPVACQATALLRRG